VRQVLLAWPHTSPKRKRVEVWSFAGASGSCTIAGVGRRSTTSKPRISQLGVRRFQRGLGVAVVMSVVNFAVWQCLLEFLYAFVRDLPIVEKQRSELGQPCKVCQPRIRDLRVVAERQVVELGQPCKVG